MGLLEKNLAALARKQPRAAKLLSRADFPVDGGVFQARSGDPGLKLGRVRLHSSRDPRSEGREQAAVAPSGPLAVLGLGLGYHVEPLLGQDLVVWEPDLGLLRLAMTARDLTVLLSGVRLALSAGDLGDLKGRGLLLHRPTARLHPGPAAALERLLLQHPAQALRPARPRVLVAPPIFGGSLPIAAWCTEALTHLGCSVQSLPLDTLAPLHDLVRNSPLDDERLDRVRAPLIRFLGELILMKAQEFQPHLCLILAQAPVDRKTIRELSRLGVVSAFWFVENYRAMPSFRHVAASYDHFMHIQGEEMEASLDALGANHWRLPMAAHPPVHQPLSLSRGDQSRFGAQVGFLGEGYPNRRKVFDGLVEEGLPITIWGTGWPRKGPLGSRVSLGGRRLESEEVVKVYNACQVVLNLHSSPKGDTPPGQNDYLNPRTFEIPACGGFMLVDRVQGLESFFIPGEEVAVFQDAGELREMCAHYLDLPEARAALAAAGRRRVLAQHTYYHRMEQMLTRTLGPALETKDSAGKVLPHGPQMTAVMNMLREHGPPLGLAAQQGG